MPDNTPDTPRREKDASHGRQLRNIVIAVVSLVAGVSIVELRSTTQGGSAISVKAGGDLQAAINRARPGDVITIEPGATFVGNFVLPPTSGSDYITLRSAADRSRFPEDGRVGPEHEQWMPTLRSPNVEPALATRPGAHHWRLQWIAFRANAGGFNDIITLGDGSDEQRNLSTVPHH